MHNDGTSKDALGANKLHKLVGDAALGIALSIGLEVAQIANVTLFVGRGSVSF